MMAGERELGPASAFQMRVEQLKHTAFGQLLKAAELENSPEALKQLLEILLIFVGVKTPQGIFAPPRSVGKPGRHVSSQTARIYSMWVSLGKPSLYRSQLAIEVFGSAFTEANGIFRRRMRHRCRRTVQRYINHLAKANSREERIERSL